MSRPYVILAGKEPDLKAAKPDDYCPGCLGDKYKPLELRIGAQSLLLTTLQRLNAIGDDKGGKAFDPIYIAGPLERYGTYQGTLGSTGGSKVRVIDTDGTLAQNLHAIGTTLAARHPGVLNVLAAGDLLPNESDLRGLERLLADEGHGIDIVQPIVRADAMRGSKRAYTIRDGDVETEYAFGQVYALRPERFRWDVVAIGARLAYARRAKGFAQRVDSAKEYLTAAALCFSPKNVPGVIAILRHLGDLDAVRNGTIQREDAERAIAACALKGRSGTRRVAIELTSFASLADDIDTEEDLGRAIAREQKQRRGLRLVR